MRKKTKKENKQREQLKKETEEQKKDSTLLTCMLQVKSGFRFTVKLIIHNQPG